MINSGDLENNDYIPLPNDEVASQNAAVEDENLLVEDENLLVEGDNLLVEGDNLLVEGENLSVDNSAAPNKSLRISPLVALLVAAGRDMPSLFSLSFALTVLLKGGYDFFQEKPLYDATFKQAYDYASMPSNETYPQYGGLGKNTSTSDPTDYAAKTANNFVDNDSIGAPLTVSNYIMIVFFGLLAVDAIGRMLLMGVDHFNGHRNLNLPFTDEDKQDAQLVNSRERKGHKYLDHYYLDAKNPGDETWVRRIYQMAHQLTDYRLFKSGPSLGECYHPLAVSLVAALASALILETIFKSNDYSLFWNHFNEKYNTLTSSNNSDSNNDQKMDDNSIAANDGAIYAMQDKMSFLSQGWVQALYWAPVATPVALLILTKLLERLSSIKMSHSYDVLAALIANVTPPLILCLTMQQLASLGAVFFVGKPIYDNTYKQAQSYAQRLVAEGGLGKTEDDALAYAASTANNIFIKFTQEVPLRIDIDLAIACLSVAAFLVMARVAQQNNHVRAFYERILPCMPKLRWTFYYPSAIGVATTLIMLTGLQIMLSFRKQSYAENQYDQKLTVQQNAGICLSDGQKMECESNAAKYGQIYGLKDFMNHLSNEDRQVLVFIIFVSALAVPVSAALYPAVQACFTKEVVALNPVNHGRSALPLFFNTNAQGARDAALTVNNSEIETPLLNSNFINGTIFSNIGNNEDRDEDRNDNANEVDQCNSW